MGLSRRRSRLPFAYLVAAAVLPLLLLGLLAVRLIVGSATPALPGQIGSAAPGFSLVDLDGNPVTLASLRGRPVIVNFWASWCTPCIAEFPLLQRAYADHAGDGLAVVGIVFQDREAAARSFMEQRGGSWPTAMDPNGLVAAAYGVDAPPASFFVDRTGVIAGRQIGELSQADLDRQLATILSPSSAEASP